MYPMRYLFSTSRGICAGCVQLSSSFLISLCFVCVCAMRPPPRAPARAARAAVVTVPSCTCQIRHGSISRRDRIVSAYHAISRSDLGLQEPGPGGGVRSSRYRLIPPPKFIASVREAAAAHRLSPAISAATVFSGHACLQPGSLPFLKRPNARLSGGLRARPPACGWAERHHHHVAPLAQAVDKSFGPDAKLMTSERMHDSKN